MEGGSRTSESELAYEAVVTQPCESSWWVAPEKGHFPGLCGMQTGLASHGREEKGTLGNKTMILQDGFCNRLVTCSRKNGWP
jgi:hypothetical protein